MAMPKVGDRVFVVFAGNITEHIAVDVGDTVVKIAPGHRYLGRWIVEDRIEDVIPVKTPEANDDSLFDRLINWLYSFPL